MSKIKIAIAGLGNCASSLIQGLEYYKSKNQDNCIGLMHWNIGDYKPGDIEVVAAFDIDQRKVGMDVAKAIFQTPNCTKIFCREIPKTNVIVKMGRVLDGIAEHMKNYDDNFTFVLSSQKESTKEELAQELKKTKADMLVNYLPVGSEKAAKFYAECALEAEVGFINCIPVFIASDPEWSIKFEKRGIPIIGDDIKSQMGSTIIHRVLTNLFKIRGVKLMRTYQLNTGGNTDFLNPKKYLKLKPFNHKQIFI